MPWIIQWNIPRNIGWNMKIHKLEYSEKKPITTRILFFRIWNIQGIFQKYVITYQIGLFFEYGIFRNIKKKTQQKYLNFGIWYITKYFTNKVRLFLKKNATFFLVGYFFCCCLFATKKM